MKIEEIKELSIDELKSKLREIRDELLQLRLRKNAGQVEKPDTFKKLRRTVARLETVLNQKQKATA